MCLPRKQLAVTRQSEYYRSDSGRRTTAAYRSRYLGNLDGNKSPLSTKERVHFVYLEHTTIEVNMALFIDAVQTRPAVE